jgi:hypothetical protein
MGRATFPAARPGRVRLGGAMRIWSLLLGLLLSGCISTLDGGPVRLYSVSDEVSQARALLEGVDGYVAQYDAVKGVSAAADAERMYFRNEIIARRMYIIDVQYSDYEAALTRDRQVVGFLTSTANQGLTIGSTLAASQASARILSGIAGGVGATKGIYDSEIIIAKTVQIIEGQMRTQRDAVAKRIMDRTAWSSTLYPLSAALTDLEDYYRAGTMNTGLLRAAGEAGESARLAGEIRGNAVILRAGSFVPNQDSAALRAFISVSDAQEASAQACLGEPGMPRDAKNRPLSIVGILAGTNFINTCRLVIECLRRKGQPI